MCWRPTRPGGITFVNDEACRLLEIGTELGGRIDGIGLTPRVLDVFQAADSAPTLATVGQRIVVVSARKVQRDGRPLGTVLVVRDRTDVESLTRQLDAVQVMSTALRAQRHEFANRLHLLNGLLHTGSGRGGAGVPGRVARIRPARYGNTGHRFRPRQPPAGIPGG